MNATDRTRFVNCWRQVREQDRARREAAILRFESQPCVELKPDAAATMAVVGWVIAILEAIWIWGGK